MINVLLLNVYVLEEKAQYRIQQAQVWKFKNKGADIGGMFGALIGALIGCVLMDKFKNKKRKNDPTPSKQSPKTKRIAILGSSGSGKTTLWQQLGANIQPKSNTQEEYIEVFKMSTEKDTINIDSTKDYGGTDDWVKYYDDVIKEETFAFFLIDLTRIEETKMEIRARIQKIDEIISNNKYEHCSIKLLATHYDEYNSKKNCSKGQAVGYAKQTLELRTIKNVKINIDERILAVNLRDKSDIEIIKNEIINIKK